MMKKYTWMFSGLSLLSGVSAVSDCSTPCSNATLEDQTGLLWEDYKLGGGNSRLKYHLGVPVTVGIFEEFKDSLSPLCTTNTIRCVGSTYELKCKCVHKACSPDLDYGAPPSELTTSIDGSSPGPYEVNIHWASWA